MNCALVIFVAVHAAGSKNYIPTGDYIQGDDFHEQSGEGAIPASICDCSHLEAIVNGAVDTRIQELEERLLDHEQIKWDRFTVQHKLRHKMTLSHLDPNKVKLKSLDFRVLRLHKDVEDMMATFQRQTESLHQTEQLVQTRMGELARVQIKYDYLEKVVGKLSKDLGRLTETPATNGETNAFSQQHMSTPVSTRPILYPKGKQDAMCQIEKAAGNVNGQKSQDCDEVYRKSGKVIHGDYQIRIQSFSAPGPIRVLCRVFNNTAWTVIQRRINGSQDFYKTWQDYKVGFGNIDGEFWLGNNNIHLLTTADKMVLRIEMENWIGKRYHAEYSHFNIDGENELYRIHVSGYHGNAGDSLTSTWENHNGHAFSTYDRDNDARHYDNCAERFHGAWWFNNCFGSHLNGKYFLKGNHRNYFFRNGIQWNTIHLYSSLKSTLMMVRPIRKV